MPHFQLLTAYINIGGDRGNVVHKDRFEPITYPEALVLQTIHGGTEHVHTLVDVGSVERTAEDEFQRLEAAYGAVVKALFPNLGGRPNVPDRDISIPSFAEVEAANAAAAKAMEAIRNGGKSRSKPGRGEKGPDDSGLNAPAGDPLIGPPSAPRVPAPADLDK